MAELGINVPSRGLFRPEAGRLGGKWVRIVLIPDMVPSSVIASYTEAGQKVLAVLARESFPGGDYSKWANTYVARHGRYVSAWQIGNEPDHDSDSSWTMEPEEYRALIRAVSPEITRVFPHTTIVGAGMASGYPGYYREALALPYLDAVAVHPYGQDADAIKAPEGNFGKASDLISGYARLGLPVWVTEFGSANRDENEVGLYVGALALQFKRDPRVEVACHFCLHDGMVPGFGLLQADLTDKPAARAFMAAVAAGGVPVAEETPTFKLGMAAYAQAHPEVGKPLENEHYLAGDDHYSLQTTEHGLLIYSKAANVVQFHPKG